MTILKEARETAFLNKKAVLDGGNPFGDKRAPTFKTLASKVIRDKAKELTNEKAAKQWESTLATYAFPTLGDMPVTAITVKDVEACLRPIWEDSTLIVAFELPQRCLASGNTTHRLPFCVDVFNITPCPNDPTVVCSGSIVGSHGFFLSGGWSRGFGNAVCNAYSLGGVGRRNLLMNIYDDSANTRENALIYTMYDPVRTMRFRIIDND